MATAVRLTHYAKNTIERGTIIRCRGKYPYEEVVDFLVCETLGSNTYELVVASGYKAGLTFVVLPKESTPADGSSGILAEWLIKNWAKWGYFDCPLDSVWLQEHYIPTLPMDNKQL